MKRYLSLLLAAVMVVTMIPIFALPAFATNDEANENLFKSSRVQRVSGDTRYDTSIAIANKLKVALGVKKFDTIIVAYGRNYADALAGSYLASLTNAPILIVNTDKNNKNDSSSMKLVENYIDKNLSDGGTVYILGGTAVISNTFMYSLKDGSRDVIRLDGANRYETNYRILKECLKFEPNPSTILVCDAYNYADSLSASSLGMPILLIDKQSGKLTNYQKAYLSKIKLSSAYVLGGTAAVPDSLATAIGKYGSVKRIAGDTRYDTSVAIAENFFNTPKSVVIAYGHDFPDGLCGGPLAYALGAPLLLTKEDSSTISLSYVEVNAKESIKNMVVLGGKNAISNSLVTNYKAVLDVTLLSDSEAYDVVGKMLIACKNNYLLAYSYYEMGDSSNTITVLAVLAEYFSSIIDMCGDHQNLQRVKTDISNAYSIDIAFFLKAYQNALTAQDYNDCIYYVGAYLNEALNHY